MSAEGSTITFWQVDCVENEIVGDESWTRVNILDYEYSQVSVHHDILGYIRRISEEYQNDLRQGCTRELLRLHGASFVVLYIGSLGRQWSPLRFFWLDHLPKQSWITCLYFTIKTFFNPQKLPASLVSKFWARCVATALLLCIFVPSLFRGEVQGWRSSHLSSRKQDALQKSTWRCGEERKIRRKKRMEIRRNREGSFHITVYFMV